MVDEDGSFGEAENLSREKIEVDKDDVFSNLSFSLFIMFSKAATRGRLGSKCPTDSRVSGDPRVQKHRKKDTLGSFEFQSPAHLFVGFRKLRPFRNGERAAEDRARGADSRGDGARRVSAACAARGGVGRRTRQARQDRKT